MGSLSLPHLLLIAVVVILLFGAGRLSNVMGEFAKGIKAFRAGMRDEDPPPHQVQQQAPPPVAAPQPVQQAAPETVGGERKIG